MVHSNNGAAAVAQVAAMLAINNEMQRITNGQPHLYSEAQLTPIRQQVADEYRVRAKAAFVARFKDRTRYYVAGVLFLLVAIPAIAVQAYALIVNDKSVNVYSGFIVGGVCALCAFLSFLFACKVRQCTFVFYYIVILYAAMGVGVCGAINFFARSYRTSTSELAALSWVAYVILAMGAIANVLCIVYFFVLACTSCSRKIIPMPPSKIPALPLPPGAQPMYSMQINPNAAMGGFNQTAFANPYAPMGYGNAGAYGNPNAFQQFQNIQPVNQVALPSSSYPNPQPMSSFNLATAPAPYRFA